MLVGLISLSLTASAAEMADTMRSEGKIWVVVAVISTILVGLIIYLITIDRKISSVEKKLDSSNKTIIHF
ncbi:MAG: hypothetical protein RL708_511 [Bacteroidota bacterium]|jgi:hypothetical protein